MAICMLTFFGTSKQETFQSWFRGTYEIVTVSHFLLAVVDTINTILHQQ